MVISRSGKPLVQAGSKAVAELELVGCSAACSRARSGRASGGSMRRCRLHRWSPRARPTACSCSSRPPASARDWGNSRLPLGKRGGGRAVRPSRALRARMLPVTHAPSARLPRAAPSLLQSPSLHPLRKAPRQGGHGVAGRTRAHHRPCRAYVATLLAHGRAWRDAPRTAHSPLPCRACR